MESLGADEVADLGGSWKVGVLFGFVTSCISALSKLAIRKSWLMLETTPTGSSANNNNNNKSAEIIVVADPKVILASRTMRWAGILGMSALNPIFDVLALSNANPSLLAPFSGLALAWIILLSEHLIGEPPQRIQICASGLIGVGLILVMAFGDHTNNEDKTLEQVQDSYREPILWVYLAAMGLWVSFLQYCINVSRNPVAQRFAWGVIGGSITGMQLFIKDTFVILNLSEDWRPWKLPLIFYILVVLGIAVPLAGLAMLTRCMKRYDVTYSNAMNAGALVVSTSLMGAVHHKTFSNLASRRRAVMYIIGLATVLVGLVVLVRHTRDTMAPNREPEDDDADTIGELTELSDAMDFAFDDIPSNAEESVGLMSRKNSVSSRNRSRTASNSSVLLEDGFTTVMRPSFPNILPATPTLRSISGGSNRDRSRTASNSSVPLEDGFTIVRRPSFPNILPATPTLRSISGGSNRDRTASSSSVTFDDNHGGIAMIRRPSFHNFPPATPTLRTTNRDRTASSSSMTNNRDRTSSTSSLQLY